MKWIGDMNSSIKDLYIYMPRNDEDYQHVVGDHTARGLPGWKPGLRQFAWDRCPAVYKNMLKGKEGFCSIFLYEGVCNCRKFIQSVSVGHPGTRNKKHNCENQQHCDGLVGGKWLAELQVLNDQCCEWNP